MSAVGADLPLSPGSQLLYERILTPSPQPLWILCWGGTNTLAQALLKLDAKYPAADSKRLRSRIRVYAISDQDDTAPWIRATFPDVVYIASVHAWNMYGTAAWTGFAAEAHYGFDAGGPDGTKVARPWLEANVHIGPLGGAYPDRARGVESATPSFLHLVCGRGGRAVCGRGGPGAGAGPRVRVEPRGGVAVARRGAERLCGARAVEHGG
jgi:hypothetical protein